MTRKAIFAAAAMGMAFASLAVSGVAQAQGGVLSQALAAGSVGEQADGYMGIAAVVGGDVRAEVDALNIKRRALYTDLAAKRGVTVSDAAAATGCQTLASRVKPGQVYRIGSGPWQTKGAAPVKLPDYCANAQ